MCLSFLPFFLLEDEREGVILKKWKLMSEKVVVVISLNYLVVLSAYIYDISFFNVSGLSRPLVTTFDPLQTFS